MYMTKILSRSKRQLQDNETLHAVNAVKMVSLLVLRNQGWGGTRLLRFSEEFNSLVESVSQELLSLTDISDTLYDETGLKLSDLTIK